MIDWLNSNSGAVQALATGVLVVVTAIYVLLTTSITRNTAKQAEASVKTADEMRRSRQDEARPVLDIRQSSYSELGTGHQAMTRAVAQKLGGDRVWCAARNIGRGPALNIAVAIRTDEGDMDKQEKGTLGVGDELEPMAFVISEDSVELRYDDVYGRTFFSRRTATSDERGPHLGPLETGEEGSR